MAGAQGPGSALILRAKEARMRAQTADLMGLTTPLPSKAGSGLISPMQGGPSFRAQPPVPAAAEVPIEERMFGVVESFLSGLAAAAQTITEEKPKGPLPPVVPDSAADVLPPSSMMR